MDYIDHLETAGRAIDKAHLATAHGGEPDWMAALRWLGKANNHLAEAAIVVAQKAYDEGATQKGMALALDVPPSTFRGMRRTESKPRRPKAPPKRTLSLGLDPDGPSVELYR